MFAIQQQRQPPSSPSTGPSMWGNFVGTLQAMFDTRQAPFRIVLKTGSGTQPLTPGDYCLNIAVANNQKDAETAWEWLHSQEGGELSTGVDRKARIQQVCARIEELLASQVTGTDEAAADDRFRATARSFRQIFGLRETERLVSYYACSYGGGLMSQGWMYISEHYLGFYSFVMGVETKLLLELKSITDIRKERSKRNLVPDSIAISTADGRELLFSNMLLSRDEAYACLQQLVNRALHRVLTSTTTSSSAGRSPATGGSPLPSAATSMNSPTLPMLTATPTMKEDLDRERQAALIQMLFNVPSGEQVLLKVWGVCWTERRPDDIYRGEVYLTNKFVLFISSDHLSAGKGGKAILILPAGAIRKMEKVYGEENGTSGEDSPYALSLYTLHHQRIYLAVGGGGGIGTRSSDHFAFRLKQVLSNNVEIARHLISAASCYASQKLVLGADHCSEVYQGLGGLFGYPRSGPIEERRENILLEYWQGHFSEVGRNFAILRTPFFEHLVMAGLPCELRGEIWSLCSGAIWEFELVSRETYDEGYYTNLLRQIAREEGLGGGSSRVSEEIEKDLHRSLPEYAAYQCDRGLKALRNVLGAYAKHDPDLGYCQAMNIVTAVLLIFVTEEVAFWILHHFCHRSLPGYYSADMHGAVLDQTVFEVLVRRHLPRLADHLSAAGVQLSMATLPWFLTLFIGTFELPYALRILDCVFLEGAPFLFRLGLAILAEAEEDIKENGISDEGGLVACLRSFCLSIGKKPVRHISRPESGDDIRISAFQALIQRAQYAYGDFVTIEVIEALRQEHKLKVIQGIADYTKKSIMRETIDGLDVSPRGRRSRSPSAESLAIGPLFLPPPAAELTLETISKAVSFYYDVFSSVLYYNDPGAKFSYGLDVDGFLSFLQPIVQWKVSEGVHVPKGITKEPSAILTFCVHLFGNSGKERSGRISFGESCHLLLDRLYLPSEDTARFIGYELFAAFSTTGDAMEYNDGLIKVTDALVSMIGEDEDQEDPMRAAFGLLKTFPMDKPISRDAFMATLSESPTLWMFLGGWARNHVRIEPIRGVSSHGPAQSPSLLSNLWTQMKGVSPWKGGTSSTKADDHSLTTDGISSAVKAASSLAVIRTPEVFTKDISARASPEETTDDASLLPDLLNLSLGQPTDSKGS